MAEEHEARQPYKCAVCGAMFDSQDQLQNHLKSCTQKRISFNRAVMPLMAGHGTFRAAIGSNTHLFKVDCEQLTT
jgi:DNA-directed RNA polymerase subunit RPC12/RpoP